MVSRIFCRNCLCGNCKIKINSLIKVFVSKVQDKLAIYSYDKKRFTDSCKEWLSKKFFSETFMSDSWNFDNIKLQKQSGRPSLAYNEKKFMLEQSKSLILPIIMTWNCLSWQLLIRLDKKENTT